jgi:UDP-N-acetylmuramoylalanine--D-glutamate ligase
LTASHAVVIGLGVTGTALARRLREQGYDVTVVEDRPGPDTAMVVSELGARFVAAPTADELRDVISGAALVAPNPGVLPTHPVHNLASELGVPVVGEIELAGRRARTPIVAVTGTNGKTTVVTLITSMLEASGLRAVAGGNIGYPLIDAVEEQVDVVVAEVSSAQLTMISTFHPSVAVWLNLADDHFDWHASIDEYADAKARIWMNQSAADVVVVNADDPTVMRHAKTAPGRVVTFGGAGDYHVDSGRLVTPTGSVIATVTDLPRSLTHDIANALAASAAAIEAGASTDACGRVLRDFAGLPHRVALVGEAGGVRWYDDSKATTPASVLAAVRAFPSVVLIAGGRNKGLDLGVLRAEAGRVRAVVAIGEAAPDVEKAFTGASAVARATSMDDAVRRATELARPGDAVLLSPGCASYDWYRNYAERGDDFERAVKELVLEAAG